MASKKAEGATGEPVPVGKAKQIKRTKSWKPVTKLSSLLNLAQCFTSPRVADFDDVDESVGTEKPGLTQVPDSNQNSFSVRVLNKTASNTSELHQKADDALKQAALAKWTASQAEAVAAKEAQQPLQQSDLTSGAQPQVGADDDTALIGFGERPSSSRASSQIGVGSPSPAHDTSSAGHESPAAHRDHHNINGSAAQSPQESPESSSQGAAPEPAAMHIRQQMILKKLNGASAQEEISSKVAEVALDDVLAPDFRHQSAASSRIMVPSVMPSHGELSTCTQESPMPSHITSIGTVPALSSPARAPATPTPQVQPETPPSLALMFRIEATSPMPPQHELRQAARSTASSGVLSLAVTATIPAAAPPATTPDAVSATSLPAPPPPVRTAMPVQEAPVLPPTRTEVRPVPEPELLPPLTFQRTALSSARSSATASVAVAETGRNVPLRAKDRAAATSGTITPSATPQRNPAPRNTPQRAHAAQQQQQQQQLQMPPPAAAATAAPAPVMPYDREYERLLDLAIETTTQDLNTVNAVAAARDSNRTRDQASGSAASSRPLQRAGEPLSLLDPTLMAQLNQAVAKMVASEARMPADAQEASSSTPVFGSSAQSSAKTDIHVSRTGSGVKQSDPHEAQGYHSRSGTSKALFVSRYTPRSLSQGGWSLSNYEINKMLHKGYAANVFQVSHNTTREQAVLKVYPWATLRDTTRRCALREVRLHARMNHNNIVKLYSAFRERDQLVLVQEFAGGRCLTDFLQHAQPEAWVADCVLFPLLSALELVHSKGCIHRDMKPDNCVFDKAGTLKLLDFGLAMDVDDQEEMLRAGTPGYMAPEVLIAPNRPQPRSQVYYNETSDLWSLGVMAYELLTGHLPFPVMREPEEMLNSMLRTRVKWPAHVSVLARDCVSQLLAWKPEDRPPVQAVMQHPWLSRHKGQQKMKTPT